MDDCTKQEEISKIFGFYWYFEYQEKNNKILRKCKEESTKVREKGNDVYRRKNHDSYIHKAVLSLYTKSIAFAPNDSEELALAYSNRSALLMHLHKYNESLIDITRALQMTKIEPLKEKLLARKLKCLTFIENGNSTNSLDASKQVSNHKTKLELPKYKTSKKILCAADCVSLEYNKKFGRHMIASRDIKPGEVIIVEQSYVLFPRQEKRYLVCSHCLKFAWAGIPCDNCVFAIYCSEKCKKEAWQDYHDIECIILPFVYCKDHENVNMSRTLITARSFITAVKKEGLENILSQAEEIDNGRDMHIKGFLYDGVFDSNKFRSCYNLLTHVDPTEEYTDDNFYELMIIYLLFSYSNILDIKVNIEDSDSIDENALLNIKSLFVKLKNIYKANGFTYQAVVCSCTDVNLCNEYCDSKQGVIIAPFCSLINHSCCPNISRMFSPGGKIIMFTVSPVKKGEQLCDSYGPSFSMKLEDRQTYLQNRFYFTCECKACIENWPAMSQDSNLMQINKLKSAIAEASLNKSSVYYDTQEKWIYNEKTLKDATKISDLTYRYLDGFDAFWFSFKYRIYIDSAFYKFYGDNCEMPDNC